jgi:hypothetical protein
MSVPIAPVAVIGRSGSYELGEVSGMVEVRTPYGATSDPVLVVPDQLVDRTLGWA